MHHFIITLAFPAQGGLGMATYSSTYNTKPGMTRADVYNDIVKWAHAQSGQSGANVVFFSLESNEPLVA